MDSDSTEVHFSFYIENDALQSGAGFGDKLLPPLGEERRVREHRQRIEG
jgi:hypothetical protein